MTTTLANGKVLTNTYDAIGRAALLGRGNDVGKKFRGRDEAEREKDE